MSESFLNQVTLDCLLNKELIQTHLINKANKSVSKKDKRFYRKRIYQLARELLMSKEEMTNISPDVKYAFDNFVKTCIFHFKTEDTCDILQEEYKNMDESGNILPDTSDLNFLDDNNVNSVDADKLMMRTIKMPNSCLTQFVKKKSTTKKDNIILPKKKDINLEDPILKTKGVKKGKKNNITNKYEETNENTKNTKKDPKKKEDADEQKN
jgi:hypothetical protein